MAVNKVVFDILSDKTLNHCVSMCCRCNQGADVSEWWRTHAPGGRYPTNHWCDHSGRLVQESFVWVIVDNKWLYLSLSAAEMIKVAISLTLTAF